MKLLAIDTATEQCSVALSLDGNCITRDTVMPRAHAELILPMIKDVLAEASISLRQLDAIAFGRGPGAFTGVRIAIGVVQGLAFACDLPVIAVSNLTAVAQQVATDPNAGQHEILVCMDARMHEVYWARFQIREGLTIPLSAEQVSSAENVVAAQHSHPLALGLGTGFRAYPQLRSLCASGLIQENALPHAREIAVLGLRDLQSGLATDAMHAQPVYLRDQVTHVNVSATNK